MKLRDDDRGNANEPTEVDESRAGLSRRKFLKLAALTGGTLGAAGAMGGLLAACGASSETTTTTTAAATTTSAAQATSSTAAPESSTTVSSDVETGRPVKIGYVVPVTGPLASFSSGAKWAQKHFEDVIGDGIVFAAGQWIKAPAGSKWPIDKVLIFTTSPDVIDVEAQLQPMTY